MFFRLLVFMIFVCFSALNTPAWAGTIYEISVSQQGTNTQIKVMFDGQATAANKVFLISDAKPRLVMDWTHAGQAIKSAKNVKNTAGIKSMRYAERGQGTRIVFDLEKPLPVLSQKVVGQAFTVTLKGQIDVTPKQRVTNLRIVPNKPRYFKRAIPFPILKPSDNSRAMLEKSNKRRPIIVIDAGHGGRDPGALGLLSNLKNSTRLINNSHRRAGYFVLLAPDVPAVLLELGYLSNVDDETLLNKASHRKKMMTSVTTAINSYFKTQKS